MNIASVFYQPHFEDATAGCVLLLPNGGLMIDDSQLLEM
jgi:hypothetical protein